MCTVQVHHGAGLNERSSAIAEHERADLRWLTILREGLGHDPYCLEAMRDGETIGVLPLAYVRSLLFGRFLVSLPYLNSGGVVVSDPAAADALIDRAVLLADELDVKHLELRHETEVVHSAFNQTLTSKVHMRLPLPSSEEELWRGFDAKVRNQIRKGEKQSFAVHWGGEPLLDDFYHVFSHNMRDLGTPVYPRRFFASMLRHLAGDAELCVVRLEGRPVAAALLVHRSGTTEVPSASSLRECNATNANMFMYWQLLKRAVERKQQVFDFGRSSQDSGTYRFKKQWGAQPHPAVWQYYVRHGSVGDMRPDSPKYQRAIQIWQRLPLRLTQWIGPPIVRGIP